MNISSSEENNDESQQKTPENDNEKFHPKVKIGKDVFIYRTLYLIAKDSLFKNKNRKQIDFFLKTQIKEKSLLHLPKPREKDVIIENIRELIELVLSLCILTNSSNYKISVFTSSFSNIENNSQLLKYTGQVLYAKMNEFKINSNNEENKILQTNDSTKFTNFRKFDNYLDKIKTRNEFPAINFKQVLPDKKFGMTAIDHNNFNKNKNRTNYASYKYININNNIFNKKSNESSYNNDIYIKDISSRSSLEKDNKYNFIQNHYLNSLYKKFDKTKLNYFTTKPYISTNFMKKSNSDLNVNPTSTYRFPPKKLKYFMKAMNRTNSQQMMRSNKTQKNIMISNDSLYNKNTNFKTRNTRNKFLNKTKKYEPMRFTYFSKENKTFIENSNKDFDKLNSLFYINKKYTRENALIDLAKRNKKQIQNIKLIQKFLIRPSIITPTANIFYSEKLEKFSVLKDIFFKFKTELRELSKNLDEYILDEDLEKLILEVDDSFKKIGINTIYGLKEYFLYVFFDNFLKKNYPEINERNILYNPDTTPEKIKEIINSLMNFLEKMKGENKYDLVDYVRKLKSLDSCVLTSDFFQIFIFCPDYFNLTKREVTKKFLLVLEVDCIKNRVTIDNFFNYYHIFRYGHLVKLEQKVMFINKLLHLMEAKGDLLQDKITSDIEYLFKIDKRTKQVLLGKVYDIKLNFHQNLKVHEIFDSIINYFNE